MVSSEGTLALKIFEELRKETNNAKSNVANQMRLKFISTTTIIGGIGVSISTYVGTNAAQLWYFFAEYGYLLFGFLFFLQFIFDLSILKFRNEIKRVGSYVRHHIEPILEREYAYKGRLWEHQMSHHDGILREKGKTKKGISKLVSLVLGESYLISTLFFYSLYFFMWAYSTWYSSNHFFDFNYFTLIILMMGLILTPLVLGGDIFTSKECSKESKESKRDKKKRIKDQQIKPFCFILFSFLILNIHHATLDGFDVESIIKDVFLVFLTWALIFLIRITEKTIAHDEPIKKIILIGSAGDWGNKIKKSLERVYSIIEFDKIYGHKKKNLEAIIEENPDAELALLAIPPMERKKIINVLESSLTIKKIICEKPSPEYKRPSLKKDSPYSLIKTVLINDHYFEKAAFKKFMDKHGQAEFSKNLPTFEGLGEIGKIEIDLLEDKEEWRNWLMVNHDEGGVVRDMGHHAFALLWKMFGKESLSTLSLKGKNIKRFKNEDQNTEEYIELKGKMKGVYIDIKLGKDGFGTEKREFRLFNKNSVPVTTINLEDKTDYACGIISLLKGGIEKNEEMASCVNDKLEEICREIKP